METETWANLRDVPEEYAGQFVYHTDTMFGVIYGNWNFALISLQVGVKVTPYRKHRVRGWEEA